MVFEWPWWGFRASRMRVALRCHSVAGTHELRCFLAGAGASWRSRGFSLLRRFFLSVCPPLFLGGPVCFFFCFGIACTSAAAPTWSASAQRAWMHGERAGGRAARGGGARGRSAAKSRRECIGKAAAGAFRPSKAHHTSASSGRFSPTLSPACRRPSAARSRR